MPKPFIKDIMQPLDKVERAWVRKPVAIIMFPLAVIIGLPIALIDYFKAAYRYWFTATWW